PKVEEPVAKPVVEVAKPAAPVAATPAQTKATSAVAPAAPTQVQVKVTTPEVAQAKPVATNAAMAAPLITESKKVVEPVATPAAPVAAAPINEAKPAAPVVASPVIVEAASVKVEPVVDTSLESLETFVITSEPAKPIEDSLPEGDQHLVLVGNITQGSWFEMQSDDGQKFRCRLAAIIRATGKYIFVNRSGMKVAEETRMTLAMALKSGRLQVLDDGMLFDRALEAVIGNLRANR
ncbi:MAG: DUF1631 family protein, partial [Moraxellaceae bacterium]